VRFVVDIEIAPSDEFKKELEFITHSEEETNMRDPLHPHIISLSLSFEGGVEGIHREEKEEEQREIQEKEENKIIPFEM
jgi:hypothetical protein